MIDNKQKIEQLAEEVARSQQPRFNAKDKASIFFSTYNWVKKASSTEPPYIPNSRNRDRWLREYVRQEPFLHGVLASVVSVDKNRGWTMLGAEPVVRTYVNRFHKLHASPDQKGWRPFTSFLSQNYHCADIGAIAEIEWTAVDIKDGFTAELHSLYSVDPTQCRLTGDIDYPLNYGETDLINMDAQEWHRNAYFRMVDEIYTDAAFNGLGVCAISRALELAKILTALYEHDAESLLSKAPRGLLLLNGITEDQWEETLGARIETMTELEKKYYTGVQVFASNGLEKVQAELVSLSKIPDGLDHVQFTNLVMNLYALAFKYDPREFWPVSGGQLGTATETETQHKKATGKGGMDFILAYQENLQELLPPVIEFEFEARDIDGEIKDESLTTAIVNNITALATNNFISADQARIMLAEAEVIHKEWADSPHQITTDKEDNPEEGHLFDAKTQTLSFLNSDKGGPALSFLKQQRSPLVDFLKKRNSQMIYPSEQQPRLEDLIEVDKEAIARSLYHYPNQRIVKYIERQGIGRYVPIQIKRKERFYSLTREGKGPGKGNWGHAGRPDQVGGSAPSKTVTINGVDVTDYQVDSTKELTVASIGSGTKQRTIQRAWITEEGEIVDVKQYGHQDFAQQVLNMDGTHLSKEDRDFLWDKGIQSPNGEHEAVLSGLTRIQLLKSEIAISTAKMDKPTLYRLQELITSGKIVTTADQDIVWSGLKFTSPPGVDIGTVGTGEHYSVDEFLQKDKVIYDTEENAILLRIKRENITDHTGSMIALFMPEPVGLQLRSIADSLALPKDTLQELATNMHVTLTFFPEDPFNDPDNITLARNIIHRTLIECKINKPLEGIIQGYGVFNGGKEGPVVYASLDIPELNQVRAVLTRQLEEQGLDYAKDHGFTPHITLAYLGAHFDLPKGFSVPDIPVKIYEITIAAGDDHTPVSIRDFSREGKGKGNWGHAGRKDKVGGSAPRTDITNNIPDAKKVEDWEKGEAKDLARRALQEAQTGFYNDQKTYYDHQLLSIETDEDLVALAVISKKKDFYTGLNGVINSLAINPKYQKQGYGSQLFEHIVQQFKEAGAKQIVLTADTAEAALYWKSKGFTMVGHNISGKPKMTYILP